MSDNRKYYYLKLKENYFDEDAIVLLESMQDGTAVDIQIKRMVCLIYMKNFTHVGLQTNRLLTN